jgi:hypothetical protein
MWYWVALTITAVVMGALVVFAIVGLLEVLRGPWNETDGDDPGSSAAARPNAKRLSEPHRSKNAPWRRSERRPAGSQ